MAKDNEGRQSEQLGTIMKEKPLNEWNNSLLRRLATVFLFFGAALPVALIYGILIGITGAITLFWLPCWNGEEENQSN